MKKLLKLFSLLLAIVAAGSISSKAGNLSAGDSLKTEKVTIKVKGMTCGGCESRVCKELDKKKGVISSKANHVDENAIIEYDPSKITESELVETINKTGFKASLENEKN